MSPTQNVVTPHLLCLACQYILQLIPIPYEASSSFAFDDSDDSWPSMTRPKVPGPICLDGLTRFRQGATRYASSRRKAKGNYHTVWSAIKDWRYSVTIIHASVTTSGDFNSNAREGQKRGEGKVLDHATSESRVSALALARNIHYRKLILPTAGKRVVPQDSAE